MNMSPGAPYIVALDAFFPLDDAGMPMWDLVYAHRINFTTEADGGDDAADTVEEAASPSAPQRMAA